MDDRGVDRDQVTVSQERGVSDDLVLLAESRITCTNHLHALLARTGTCQRSVAITREGAVQSARASKWCDQMGRARGTSRTGGRGRANRARGDPGWFRLVAVRTMKQASLSHGNLCSLNRVYSTFPL